jgi:hypothetical protein
MRIRQRSHPECAPARLGEKVIFAYPELPLSALFIVSLGKGGFTDEGVDVVRQRHEG